MSLFAGTTPHSLHHSRFHLSLSRRLLSHRPASRRVLSTTSSSPASSPNRRKWPSYLTAFAIGLAITAAYNASRPQSDDKDLNPYTFTPFTLISKEAVSSTSTIFTLRQPRPSLSQIPQSQRPWDAGAWSVEVKQPQLQIARAYTPLPPSPAPIATSASSPRTGQQDESEQDIRLLVRREHHGELSNYLHRLAIDSTADLRGPRVGYHIPDNVENIVFLAGGTGIAPALQVAHTLLEHRTSTNTTGEKSQDTVTPSIPRIHIIWANRRREDCVGGISDFPDTSPGLGIWRGLTSRLGFDSDEKSAAGLATHPPTKRDEGAIVAHLSALKTLYPSQLSIDYFVDEERTFISARTVQTSITRSNHLNGSVDNTAEAAARRCHGRGHQQQGKNIILVSGPDGFVQHFAGPKKWSDGQEIQGPVGGILGSLDLSRWEVWKL